VLRKLATPLFSDRRNLAAHSDLSVRNSTALGMAEDEAAHFSDDQPALSAADLLAYRNIPASVSPRRAASNAR
jgi:hypothetical protein